MIILRNGEKLRHTYPGKLKIKGGKNGIMTITTRRICFEDEKHGMSMDLPLKDLYDWDVKRKSIVFHWKEDGTKFHGEFEIHKKDGRNVTAEELHYAVYYAKTDHHGWVVWDRPEWMIDLWFCNNKGYRGKDYWKKIDKISSDRTKIIKKADGTLYIHEDHMKRHVLEDVTHEIDKKSKDWKQAEKMWDVWKESNGPNKTTLQEKIRGKVEHHRDPKMHRGNVKNWKEQKAKWEMEGNSVELNRIYPSYPVEDKGHVIHLGFDGGRIDEKIKGIENALKLTEATYGPLVVAAGLIRNYVQLWYYYRIIRWPLIELIQSGADLASVKTEDIIQVQTMSKKTEFESEVTETR